MIAPCLTLHCIAVIVILSLILCFSRSPNQAFASWLQSFFEKAPEQARQANAWAHLERFQRTLGGGLDQAGLALTARSASAPVLPGVSNGAATPYVRTPYVKGGARAPKDASQQQPEQQQTSKDDLLVRSRSDVLKPSDAGLSTPTVDQSVIASSGVQAVNGTAPATPIKHGPVSAVNVDGKLLPVISPSRFAQSSASQLAAAASDELPPASRLNLPATQMNRDVSVSCGSNLIPRNDSVMVPPASTDPGTGHVFISRSDIRMLVNLAIPFSSSDIHSGVLTLCLDTCIGVRCLAVPQHTVVLRQERMVTHAIRT